MWGSMTQGAPTRRVTTSPVEMFAYSPAGPPSSREMAAQHHVPPCSPEEAIAVSVHVLPGLYEPPCIIV
jgi:hypothetical protein